MAALKRRHRQLLDHPYPSTWAPCALHTSQRGPFNRTEQPGYKWWAEFFWGGDKFEVEEGHSKSWNPWFFFLKKIVISKEIPARLWEVPIEAQAIAEVGLRSNRWVGKSFNKYPNEGKYTIPWADLGMWILRWIFMRINFHFFTPLDLIQDMFNGTLQHIPWKSGKFVKYTIPNTQCMVYDICSIHSAIFLMANVDRCCKYSIHWASGNYLWNLAYLGRTWCLTPRKGPAWPNGKLALMFDPLQRSPGRRSPAGEWWVVAVRGVIYTLENSRRVHLKIIQLKKENHLNQTNQTSIFVFRVSFPGCYILSKLNTQFHVHSLTQRRWHSTTFSP